MSKKKNYFLYLCFFRLKIVFFVYAKSISAVPELLSLSLFVNPCRFRIKIGPAFELVSVLLGVVDKDGDGDLGDDTD